MQRPTNLIQSFRLPDKGCSPGAPPLITTAIKWPVWTRDVPDMKQGSASLVSQCFLGNSHGAWGKRTERPHILIRIPPTSSVCEERGWQMYPHNSRRLPGFCTHVISLPHSRPLTCFSVTHPKFSPPHGNSGSYSGGVTHWLHKGTTRSKIMTFFSWISLCWYRWPSWNLIGFVWSGSHLHAITPSCKQTQHCWMPRCLSHSFFWDESQPQTSYRR